MSASVNLKINKLAILPLLTAAALTAEALQLASGPWESQADGFLTAFPTPVHSKFHCYLAQSMLESWPVSPAGSFLNRKNNFIFHRISDLTALSPIGVDRSGSWTVSSISSVQAPCAHMVTVPQPQLMHRKFVFTPQQWRTSPFLLPQPFALSRTVGLSPFFPRSQYKSRIPGEMEMERLSVDLRSNLLLQIDWVVQSALGIQAFIQSDLDSMEIIQPLKPTSSPANLYSYGTKKKKKSWEQSMICRVVGKAHSQSQFVKRRMGKGPPAMKSLG